MLNSSPSVRPSQLFLLGPGLALVPSVPVSSLVNSSCLFTFSHFQFAIFASFSYICNPLYKTPRVTKPTC